MCFCGLKYRRMYCLTYCWKTIVPTCRLGKRPTPPSLCLSSSVFLFLCLSLPFVCLHCTSSRRLHRDTEPFSGYQGERGREGGREIARQSTPQMCGPYLFCTLPQAAGGVGGGSCTALLYPRRAVFTGLAVGLMDGSGAPERERDEGRLESCIVLGWLGKAAISI